MADIDEYINQRLHELRELATKHAKAKAQANYLEEFKKSKLSILMKKYERAGHQTAAAQEREARADQEYMEVLDGLRTAVEVSEEARWSLEVAKMAIEVWRTRRADQRAEMNLT